MHVDIGYGDAVTPAPIDIEYPSMLGQPRAALRAYPPETVIAEKFQAMVALDMLNSRMKDFYDIWAITWKNRLAWSRPMGISDLVDDQQLVRVDGTMERFRPCFSARNVTAVVRGDPLPKHGWEIPLQQKIP